MAGSSFIPDCFQKDDKLEAVSPQAYFITYI